jgi:hypothetical protein
MLIALRHVLEQAALVLLLGVGVALTQYLQIRSGPRPPRGPVEPIDREP